MTVPAHATRLFQSACHQQGLCHSIVFLDLQEAFYRIVRPLITGGPLTQEAVAAACRAVNLPSGVYHEVQAHLQQPALLQGGGASEWATRALEETLQDTWFKFPCEPELVVTKIGSRPGDSLSHLVFSLLFAKVLARIRQILREAGHVTTIPWHASMTGRLRPVEEPVHDTVELLDSTWMDDLSLMLRAQNSTVLLDRLRAGTAVLLDACLEHALLRIWDGAKTEALVMPTLLWHQGSQTTPLYRRARHPPSGLPPVAECQTAYHTDLQTPRWYPTPPRTSGSEKLKPALRRHGLHLIRGSRRSSHPQPSRHVTKCRSSTPLSLQSCSTDAAHGRLPLMPVSTHYKAP